MAWADLHAYMSKRDPAFAKSCKPVAREDIAACEQGLGITLPGMYVELLAAMGADSGRYRPFGWDQDHGFHELIEQLRFATYPTDRYFRVSRQIDDSLDTIEEPYLDLTRAAGDDTPLVTIYDGGAFDPELVYEQRRTLAEMLTLNAFRAFELAERPRKQGVSTFAESPAEAAGLRDAAVARLRDAGLEVLLPPQPRLVCLGNRELATLVELHGEGGTSLAIDVHGTDHAVVRPFAEALAASVPRASLVRPGMRTGSE